VRYGISAAALVVRDGQLLLVNHREADGFDYWLPPGGGLEGDESILDCVRRETFEETGLRIAPGPILYVQEFVEPGYHFVKFFCLCAPVRGELTLANRVAGEDWLVDVRFFSREALHALTVYPEILKDQFWADLEAGVLRTRYLGLKHIPP
jgi:8-oxo-dGTP diphosphatase